MKLREMKESRIYKVWLFALGAILFAGCTDLEVVPEDAFTEFEIFKDARAYRSYLAKCYAAFSLTGQL